MQKVKDAKIGWVPKALLVLAVLLFSLLFLNFHESKTVLRTSNKTYFLEAVSSQAQLEKGLGDRNSIPANSGMLFIFNRPGLECIWMKDMHFPLDIVWLSSSKEVLHIEYDISPTTYPKTYCPKVNAQYVIELNSGQAKNGGISDGQTLNF